MGPAKTVFNDKGTRREAGLVSCHEVYLASGANKRQVMEALVSDGAPRPVAKSRNNRVRLYKEADVARFLEEVDFSAYATMGNNAKSGPMAVGHHLRLAKQFYGVLWKYSRCSG